MINISLNRSLILLIIIHFYNLLTAQVANIESERIVTDTTGWAGSMKLGLTIDKEVSTVIEAIGEAHLQFKTVKSLFLLRANANFTKAGNTTFASNSFFHLRHNYKLNSWLRWEEFTQVQTNKVTGIELRYLLGTGPRFKLIQRPWISIYVGTAIMYEYEREVGPENIKIIHEQPRSSSYLSFTIQSNESFKWAQTVYYQTLYDFPEDHRFATQTDLEFKISKKLSYVLTYKMLYDTLPAFGIPNTTYSLESYLSLKF